ncbi:MAG: hypothetical protein AAF387_18630 [Pseudomonadota bacterium]
MKQHSLFVAAIVLLILGASGCASTGVVPAEEKPEAVQPNAYGLDMGGQPFWCTGDFQICQFLGDATIWHCPGSSTYEEFDPAQCRRVVQGEPA